MKDLRQFISTTIREFLNENKTDIFNKDEKEALISIYRNRLFDKVRGSDLYKKYVEKYKTDKCLDDEEEKLLTTFLKDCLDRKKLLRVKDVIYDRTNGSIKEIPALAYTKINKHFTIIYSNKKSFY